MENKWWAVFFLSISYSLRKFTSVETSIFHNTKLTFHSYNSKISNDLKNCRKCYGWLMFLSVLIVTDKTPLFTAFLERVSRETSPQLALFTDSFSAIIEHVLKQKLKLRYA